jgi:L-lactate permease
MGLCHHQEADQAEQLGLSPVLMAAASSSGGVMGKMIDAQSIVVASTATNWFGHEGSILRFVFGHSIVLASPRVHHAGRHVAVLRAWRVSPESAAASGPEDGPAVGCRRQPSARRPPPWG